MTEPRAGTIEIDYYYERVAAALADLPQEARDELLEDLPAHFAEVLAEQGGPLVERLGPPADLRRRAARRRRARRPARPAAADRAPHRPSTRAAGRRAAGARPAGRPGHRLPAGHRVPAPAAPRLVGRPRGRRSWCWSSPPDIVPGGPLRRPARLAAHGGRVIVSMRHRRRPGVPRHAALVGFADTAVGVSACCCHRQRAWTTAAVHRPGLLRRPVRPVRRRDQRLPRRRARPAAGAHHAVRPERQPDLQVGDYLALHNGQGGTPASYPLCLGAARPTGADGRADRHPDRLPIGVTPTATASATTAPAAASPSATGTATTTSAEPRTEPVALAFG